MKTTFKNSRRTQLFKTLLAFFGCLLFLISTSCQKDESDQDYLMKSTDKSKKAKTKQDISDVDGNVYKTVKIGNQLWMAENLRTTKYNDGTDIPLVTTNQAWLTLSSPGFCWFNNSFETFGVTYGGLYNWWVVGTGKLCPTGWHVPTDVEWHQLILYLDPQANPLTPYDPASEIAGGKLKEVGTAHWVSPNEGATDEFGFAGLPGSARDGLGNFLEIGYDGHWWSSTEVNSSSAWLYYVSHLWSGVSRIPPPKYYAVSVRCIQD